MNLCYVTIKSLMPICVKTTKENFTDQKGNEYTIPYVRFGQHYFCTVYRKNTYNLYDVVVKENTNELLTEFSIPLFWGSRKYCEYVEIEDLYGEEEGTILLRQFLERTIKELNEKGVQIIENNVKIETDSQYLKLTGFLLVDIEQSEN